MQAHKGLYPTTGFHCARLFITTRYGPRATIATSTFTIRSPIAHDTQRGASVAITDNKGIVSEAKGSLTPRIAKLAAKASVKNNVVSTTDPRIEPTQGAFHQAL